MASSCFKNMGPSYMNSVCFDVDNYRNEFSKHYKVKDEDIKIHKYEGTFSELFKNLYLDEDNIINGLKYWLEMELDEIKNIYIEDEDSKLDSLLSGSEGGVSGFYSVEEVIFIEFEKTMLVIIIGNNE